MKTMMLFILVACMAAGSLNAQVISTSLGSQAPFKPTKRAKPLTFNIGGQRYFFTRTYRSASMEYKLLSYNEQGNVVKNADVEIQRGIMNNSYSIDDIVQLDQKLFVLVEHLDKASGKNTLSARPLDNALNTDAETELVTIPFEKMMNSGDNYPVVSPDKNMLAVVADLPFVKEQPGSMKIALFDKNLKKLGENQVTLPGENTKNKSISVQVNNNGMVYIIRKTTGSKRSTLLTIYQYDGVKGGEVKEYNIAPALPTQIYSYTTAINPAGELVVAGTSTQLQTLSGGDTKASGLFYFFTDGSKEGQFKLSPLDNPIENLQARQVIFNKETGFLITEQLKEESEPPPPGNLNADYRYIYKHKSDFVFGLTADGTKNFQIEIAKEFTSVDYDAHLFSGYFICNGLLTVVYNDNYNKYNTNKRYTILPVLAQITNDGLLKAPVAFDKSLNFDNSFNPAIGTQDSDNQVSILMLTNDRESAQLVTVKVTE